MKFNICVFLILLFLGIIPGIIYLIACGISKKGTPITQPIIIKVQQPTIIQNPIPMLYCTNCGFQNNPKNKFCQDCGILINH